MVDEVRRLAVGTTNVRVSPPVPSDEYPELLASADVHVVIQRGVSANANLPSKVASYLASGRPIVASISPDSTASSVLIDSGAALVVRPDAPQELADAMRTLSANPGLGRELGARARAYAEEQFRPRAGSRQARGRFDRVASSYSSPAPASRKSAGGAGVRPSGTDSARPQT